MAARNPWLIVTGGDILKHGRWRPGETGLLQKSDGLYVPWKRFVAIQRLDQDDLRPVEQISSNAMAGAGLGLAVAPFLSAVSAMGGALTGAVLGAYRAYRLQEKRRINIMLIAEDGTATAITSTEVWQDIMDWTNGGIPAEPAPEPMGIGVDCQPSAPASFAEKLVGMIPILKKGKTK